MPKDNVSLFEIFGPVMIGPSSSHTAGVARVAFLARKMYGTVPAKVTIRFYGSLAATWKGHGSADAAIAGLLGIPPEDEDLFRGREKLRELQKNGKGFSYEIIPMPDLPPYWHPNTVAFELHDEQGNNEKRLKVRAASIGGGSICINEINGYEVSLSGELQAILVLHRDEVGVIAKITNVLASNSINIAATSSHRKQKGEEAMLVVETDGVIPAGVINEIGALSPVERVLWVPSLYTPIADEATENEIQI